MPINKNAESEIAATRKIHRSLTDFGAFLQSIRDNTAGNIANVLRVPARVTALLDDKAAFDALGLSAAEIRSIMEDEFNYVDWSTEVSNFTSVFSKAPSLRTSIINNVNLMVPSYNGDTVEYTAGVSQAILESQLDDILQHYA